jgi:N-hydroxyarylamine O-acetyltransferase
MGERRMNELNGLFRKRIGFPEYAKITFQDLDEVLDKTAKAIPFENLCIIDNKTLEISKENLISKMLISKQGGLCYELNPLFYFFLMENDFHAKLVQGIVYDHAAKDWSRTGNTHAAILLMENEQTYLIDTGFGGNLPLKPVPFNGEIISSESGQFRITKTPGLQKDYCLEMKLKYKDKEWKKGYAFDSESINMTELNKIQEIIRDSAESPFNKNRLLTRFTENGNITLTDTSFTQSVNGEVKKESIDKANFESLAEKYFNM